MNYKPCSTSNLTITELMVPAYTDFGGKVHGGTILSLIDKVAYAVAIKHSENYCVTLSLDKVLFLKSIEVGELVHPKRVRQLCRAYIYGGGGEGNGRKHQNRRNPTYQFLISDHGCLK